MIDLKPRTMTPQQVETFREYANMIKKEIVRRDASGDFAIESDQVDLASTASTSSKLVSTSDQIVDLVSTASTSSMISMEEMYIPGREE